MVMKCLVMIWTNPKWFCLRAQTLHPYLVKSSRFCVVKKKVTFTTKKWKAVTVLKVIFTLSQTLKILTCCHAYIYHLTIHWKDTLLVLGKRCLSRLEPSFQNISRLHFCLFENCTFSTYYGILSKNHHWNILYNKILFAYVIDLLPSHFQFG